MTGKNVCMTGKTVRQELIAQARAKAILSERDTGKSVNGKDALLMALDGCSNAKGGSTKHLIYLYATSLTETAYLRVAREIERSLQHA